MLNGETSVISRHWAQIAETTFVPGMRLIFWLHRKAGRWSARVILYPVVLWYALMSPSARAASRDYLRRIASTDRNARLHTGSLGVLRHFRSFAECMLDKMLLWGDVSRADVVLHGEDLIATQIASGRGAVLVCSHLGNLELCRVLSRGVGLKVTVLTHTKHAKKFNELLERLAPGSQLDLMQVTEITPATAMLLSEKISRGELVAIAGDRVPISPVPLVAWAKFLNETAPFPTGPYVLAHLLQCPVFLLFSIKQAGRNEVYFELFREAVELSRANREAALASLTAAYAERLEYFCRRSPLEWFNFYRFWELPSLDNSSTVNVSK